MTDTMKAASIVVIPEITVPADVTERAGELLFELNRTTIQLMDLAGQAINEVGTVYTTTMDEVGHYVGDSDKVAEAIGGRLGWTAIWELLRRIGDAFNEDFDYRPEPKEGQG